MKELASTIINIPIIPVLLMPVTGLLCLTFYNRATSMHQRLRALQKELRELYLESPKEFSSKEKEMAQSLLLEVQKLHHRSRLIAFALLCFLLSILFFSLCALFIVLNLYLSWTVSLALMFWFLGPIFICTGILAAAIELLYSQNSIKTETHLIKRWHQE